MADVVGQILEEARRRCGQAEVYEESGETRSVDFEDNRLKRVSARQFRGVGLRVIREGRIGFASTTDLRDVRRLVEMAEASARFGERAAFELPGPPAHVPRVVTEDPAVRDVTQERMVEMGRQALEHSRAAGDAYQFAAGLGTRFQEVRIVSTAGLDVRYSATDMAASVEIQEVSERGLLWVYEQKAWGRPLDGLTDVTETALTKMRQAAVVVAAPAEVMPVLFSPKAVDNLLEPIVVALSGKRVHKGSSRLAGRLGSRIVDERVTISDDPTVDFAPASAPFDDEGLACRRTALVERGVLKTYLLDLQTAGLLDMEPGANGHRSYGTPPEPAAANLVIDPGADSYTALVAGMRRGLIVDQVLGSGQSNVLAGEFSVNVHLGFLVEDGKVRGRVKDCMVAGNAYDLLSRVEGISRERQWVDKDLLPAICVSGIRLAARD